ncbi:MAG TPA: GTP cyclohydrolase I FolE [Trichormus sp.]|jgi:GTP cyclohydrolase I
MTTLTGSGNPIVCNPAAPSATRYAGLVVPQNHNAGAKAMDLNKIAQGVRLILEGVGEDPQREGLLETPSRVARMYQELLYGTHEDPASEITCTFNEDTDEMILVRDIIFASTCEHHLVPFVGVAHVAYIPKDGRITGLSKLARVVELASRRLQVQERMTSQIADALERVLRPGGVAVVLEAEHFCMSIRGVRKPGAKTVTSALRGTFRDDKKTRAEVMALIKRGRD